MTTEQGDFAIRPIAAGDAEAIVEMARELSAHERSPPPKLLAEDVLDELARPDCVLLGFLAERGAAPLGYALHTISFDTESGRRGAFMCDLYVKPSARRNGLARALMTAIVQDTVARGGTWVSWGALADNAEAQAYYRTLGKVEEGVQLWSITNGDFTRLARLP